jgi:raffinose/stachyose/melibiose transport system permease protein
MKRKKISIIINYLVCIIFTAIIMIPMYIVVTGGLKTSGEIRTNPFGLPKHLRLDIYSYFLNPFISDNNYWDYLANSINILAGTVIIELIVVCMAGFALARINFIGRNVLYYYFILGLLFPLSVAILPLYILLRDLNLLNSHLGIILPQVAFGIPFHSILIISFFKSIPKQIEEASYLDGCGSLGFFFHIVLPLSKAPIATISVLAMVASWNNYILPRLVIDDYDLASLPIGVMSFVSRFFTPWNFVLPFVTITLIPVVVFYIYAQKYIMRGFSGSAIKG